MFRRIASLVALVSFSGLVVGCAGQVSSAEMGDAVSPLTDPCSGASVGYVDVVEDKLMFDDGFEVSRADVIQLDAYQMPSPTCEDDEVPEPGEMRTMAIWANSRCYMISESYAGGTASCHGCCLPAGPGAFDCFESCSDAMSN